mgnify:FL=1
MLENKFRYSTVYGVHRLITLVLLWAATNGLAFANTTSFAIDASETSVHPIGNRFSNVSVWSFKGTSADENMFQEWAEKKPAGWLNEQYPWLKEIQVYIASGGSYLAYPRQDGDTAETEFDRDLFKDPSDRSVLDDYDFSALVRACHNMLRQGVRPCLKLHSVPVKYSSSPDIDWFRVNTRPPDDQEVHADYISALVQAMVDAFGRPEVLTWRWYVGTEFENKTWWEAEDETPESSAEEFLKFYDWTVYAVERVLGEAGGPIGSHAMMEGGLWDPEIFFEHCHSGKNFATGKRGTRLDFFGISHYDRTAVDLDSIKESWPEMSGTGNVLASLDRFPGGVDIPADANLDGFEGRMKRTRELLEKYEFPPIPIEVSEGGMVYGTDGKWLWHGLARGGSFDASWTALSFKKMLDLDVELWSRWPMYRTSGLYSGPELAATNAIRLIDRMSNDRRISVQSSGDAGTEIVASLSPQDEVLRVLSFNHSPDLKKPNPVEKLELDLVHLPFDGRVSVVVWRIDESHADFWPQWEKDRAAHGITDADYYQSRDMPDPAHALLSQEHIDFWKSRESAYVDQAELRKASILYAEVKNGRLTVDLEMPCFAVALIEVQEIP